MNLEWKNINMTKFKDCEYKPGSYDAAHGLKIPLSLKLLLYPIIYLFEYLTEEWKVKPRE